MDKYPNRITGKPGIGPFYIRKKETYSPDWVGEWDSIQQRRKNHDPLMQGGQALKRHKSLEDLFT